MAPALVETSTAQPEIVDISHLRLGELEPLWERERRLWLEKLFWDVSPVISVIRRAADRGKLRGKAARLGDKALGYSYYMLEGHRAVVGSLVLTPEVDPHPIGSRILEALLGSLQLDPSVVRIESQFVSFHQSWLTESFVSHGFDVHPRAFLRRSLKRLPREVPTSPSLVFELWSSSRLDEASVLMLQAHLGSADAEMNELYRTQVGCRTLLENTLYQRGCGMPIPAASFVVRDPADRLNGLVISTEISPGHAHLAQVAVSPTMQGKGLGRFFLTRALTQLAQQGYRTVSLMVSGSNQKALALYDSVGFGNVIRFPVFSWDGRVREARSRSTPGVHRDF